MRVFCKMRMASGQHMAAEIEAPANIAHIEDVEAQYSALAEHINAEYDFDEDVVEIIDARGYY